MANLPQPAASPAERRRQPRFTPASLAVQLRPKGQINRFSVDALDFNRHGLAVQCDRPLVKDQLVFLSLNDGKIALERVIGVVHNCLPQQPGYRCGIRFRTQSSLQFDRDMVEAQLVQLEQTLLDDEDED